MKITNKQKIEEAIEIFREHSKSVGDNSVGGFNAGLGKVIASVIIAEQIKETGSEVSGHMENFITSFNDKIFSR